MLQIIGEMNDVAHIWIGLRNMLTDFELGKASKVTAFGVTPTFSTHLALFCGM